MLGLSGTISSVRPCADEIPWQQRSRVSPNRREFSVTEELSTPRRGRRLAAVLAGVLALGIVPFAFPASSQTNANAQLRDIRENACPVDDGPDNEFGTADDTTEVPEDGFTDTVGTTFEFEIDCVAWYDVTSGVTLTTYVPAGHVTRGQMATFIANLIDYVDEGALDDAAVTGDAFPCPSDPDDLVETDTHYTNIQRLADADIVQGGPQGRPADCYGPDMRVTRAQMATFIAVAQEFLGEPIEIPATTTTEAGVTTTTAGGTTTTGVPTAASNFFDDDDTSVHEANINAIAFEGIVIGTSGRNYSPENDITRGQMAAFLARKLDYLIEEGDATTPPPAATTTTTVAVTTTTVAT